MAARVGRAVIIEFGGASPANTIAGARETGLECNGEPIDITANDNSGVRTLLSNLSAEDQVSVSVSGVVKDTRLKTHWFANTRTQLLTLTYPDGSTVSGTFYMSSYSEGEPYNDASTFEASFMSSGTVTFTP